MEDIRESPEDSSASGNVGETPSKIPESSTARREHGTENSAALTSASMDASSEPPSASTAPSPARSPDDELVASKNELSGVQLPPSVAEIGPHLSGGGPKTSSGSTWSGDGACAVGPSSPVVDPPPSVPIPAVTSWNVPPVNPLLGMNLVTRMFTSQARSALERLPSFPLAAAAAQNQDSPSLGPDVCQGGNAFDQPVEAPNEQATAVSTVRANMVAGKSDRDSTGASCGAVETAGTGEAQQAADVRNGDARAIDNGNSGGTELSVTQLPAADKAVLLERSAAAPLKESVKARSNGSVAHSRDSLAAVPTSSAPCAGTEGSSCPEQAAEGHNSVEVRLEGVSDPTDAGRHLGGKRIGDNSLSSEAAPADRSDALPSGAHATETVGIAARSDAPTAHLADGKQLNEVRQAQGGEAHTTAAGATAARKDSLSTSQPASGIFAGHEQVNSEVAAVAAASEVMKKVKMEPVPADDHLAWAETGLVGNMDAIGSFACAAATPTEEIGSSVAPEERVSSGPAKYVGAAGTAAALGDANTSPVPVAGSFVGGVVPEPSHAEEGCPSASDNAVAGSAVAASVDSEYTSTVCSLEYSSEHGRYGIERDPLGCVSSGGEGGGSSLPEDTVDVALAALSYADAAAAAPGAGSNRAATAEREDGCNGGHHPLDPNSADAASPVLAAIESDAAGMQNLASDEPGRVGEVISAAFAATATADAPVGARLATGTLLHGEAVPQVAGGHRAGVIVTAPPASGTARAAASIGIEMTARKGKSARARDRRDDMMQVMCMICLEKLSEAAEGGGAKLLGLLDSCSHRYCYTVCRVTGVGVLGSLAL